MILYNEIEPYCVEWLGNLSSRNLIAPGRVESRSIKDLRAEDVQGLTQAHFFAGLGGWSYALRLAGWPDDVPVWTGSCPCQMLSNARNQVRGKIDERHLWPDWYRLITLARPSIIFGEQVASPDGKLWLDAVSLDLEDLGYSVGSASLCAAGLGAPHLRQRLYFVAIADDAHPKLVGHADGDGAREHDRELPASEVEHSRRGEDSGHSSLSASATRGHWADADWLHCTDGRTRPVEPGTFPLAHGVSNRVGRCRAYGNAIVPQVAATFIASVVDLYAPKI